MSAFETEHHLVALCLGEVGVHLSTVDFQSDEGAANFFHLLFFSAKDDDTLEIIVLENGFDDTEFLRFVTHISILFDFLGGSAYCKFNFDGIFE